MPSHNPECTHGYSHDYSACRDGRGTPLKMLEDPISANPAELPASEAGNAPQTGSDAGATPPTTNILTDADREALRAALAGLPPVAVDLGSITDEDGREARVGVITGDLGSHDPSRDPDADADAAQRAADQF